MEPTRPAKTTGPVSRGAKIEGATRNVKPVVQRKKPEPLPISDDIWELPLSSPVSQEQKVGGKVQEHSAVKGRLIGKGKVVPGNRGRGKGRSYKSEARVVDSSEGEGTPHSGSGPVGPVASRPLGGMETGKSAPAPQPRALTKTVHPTQTSEAQPNPRRSLRERKPPKVVLIPSSGGESEGEELVQYTPGKAPTRLLSPGKKQKPVTTNKRALPEAYKINPPIKKRKDAPVPESIDARRGARVVQLGEKQEGAEEPRAVGGKPSAVALEHVRNRKTTAMSSKRKAHKPTTPKELTEGSHKRQRTSSPKTVGHGKKGGVRAPTLDANDSPGATVSFPQMDVPPEVRDLIRGGPDLDGRAADNGDALPPLNKKEYINHKGNKEQGRTSNISGLETPLELNAHYPQTAQKFFGGLDDLRKGAFTHGRESQKRRLNLLEPVPKELLPQETTNLAKRLSSADTLGTYSPSGSSTAPHDPQENPRGNAPAASVNMSKALTSRPTPNLLDASTSTADLDEDRVMSISHSRTSGPPPQITGENVSVVPKQMRGVTSLMMQLKDKVTCDRAVSASAVSETAINDLCLLGPIEFSRENSPMEPIAHNATHDEELSIPDDLAKLSTTQRLQSLVILSEGDEDIVVWDTKEKMGEFTGLRRKETGHTEVDENGSPSRPGAPKPQAGPKRVSFEVLEEPKDPVPESSREPETEEDVLSKSSPSILGERTSLGGQLFVEQTHHLVRTSAKGGKPKNPRIKTGGRGGQGHFKHKDSVTRYINGPKNTSTELPSPLEKLHERARDVISISSTSPAPASPISLPPKKLRTICQEPEPWEDSDDAKSMKPAVAKVLKILAERSTSIPKSSPPVLHHPKSKVQLIRNGKRKLGDNNNFVQGARVETTSAEDGPFEDTVLVRGGHPETHFSKMLRKQRFVRIQRLPYHGNPPNRRLAEEQFSRASRVAPIKGEHIRRQEWIEDSCQGGLDGDTDVEDSMGAYTDYNGSDINTDTYSYSEYSGSGDSGDEDENGEEGEEDAHIIWRKSLPGHLKETLSALEQITRGLVKYLVCSEELAIEMIENFEAQGTRLVKALDDSHTQEYNEFLENLEEAKKAVAAKAEELDQLIRNGLDSVERKEEDWKNNQMAKKKQHQKLDNAIEEMLMDTNN
ncbi:hypothetical protein HOY80DRAFT_1016191 [Tuber brumale]|nr:hypothetical protein HOY80DRAFT_1016191 [Tuber brumale]